jgi:hypothetical protein
MATSGRARGGGKATRRSKKAPVGPTGEVAEVETIDEISLSTFCAPARPHLLTMSVAAPIAAAASRRRR